MQTEDLIRQLTREVPATHRHAAMRRLSVALGAGAAVALVTLVATLGLRPDIGQASATAPFWMKWLYTLALVGGAIVVVRRLGDPDGRVGLAWWGLAAPIAVVAMMAVGELMVTPQQLWAAQAMGRTALRCALAIPLLAGPVFAGLIWGFRRLAPTRLRLTGAASGLLAGAAAATVYALACPEHAAAFMILWYTAGMFATAAYGAIIGPIALRW